MRDAHISQVIGWVLIAGITAAPARADWPHWRGDGGNGGAMTAKPPVEFGADHNLRWKAEISGHGTSSPVVVGEQVFVTTAIPVEGEPGLLDFRLLCFDRETGRELWARSCVKATPHEGTHETNGFAAALSGPSTWLAENDVGEGVDATPALAGDSLFVRGERHLFRFAEP